MLSCTARPAQSWCFDKRADLSQADGHESGPGQSSLRFWGGGREPLRLQSRHDQVGGGGRRHPGTINADLRRQRGLVDILEPWDCG